MATARLVIIIIIIIIIIIHFCTSLEINACIITREMYCMRDEIESVFIVKTNIEI